MCSRKTLKINFFKSYSKEGEKLKELIEKKLVPFCNNELSINVSFETHDSAGLSPMDSSSSYKLLTAAFKNEIVIIDASIEEFKDRKFGVNFDCVTPAISSLDNVLVVSRTQFPLNFFASRTNVALLGEEDKLNPENNNGGYTKKYTNDQIITWICKEFSIMHNNPEGSRLLRPDDLKIDTTMSFPEIMKKELAVSDENMKALQKEKHPKKQAFISYRTYYFNAPTGNEEQEIEANDCKYNKIPKNRHFYNGKYDIDVVAKEIEKYHNEQGEHDQWMKPFYYSSGVLSKEFLPEFRRWAFISYPDQKIRECDEFWIFNTQYKVKDGDGEEEKGYWDSWWCVGEFLTIVRMKYNKQLVCREDGKIYKKHNNYVNGQLEKEKEFKIMLFNPDNEKPIQELFFNQIPDMTEVQYKELSKYFANSDFREAGIKSMSGMSFQRYLPKFIRSFFLKLIPIKLSTRLNIKGVLNEASSNNFEKSVSSHIYDKSFIQGRLLECNTCSRKGRKMEEVLNDNHFIWDFLNINNYYSKKGIHNVKERTDIIHLTEKELDSCRQPNGDYIIKCKMGHNTIVRKSEDSFYLYWRPHGDQYTGPQECIIEAFDVYEVVD